MRHLKNVGAFFACLWFLWVGSQLIVVVVLTGNWNWSWNCDGPCKWQWGKGRGEWDREWTGNLLSNLFVNVFFLPHHYIHEAWTELCRPSNDKRSTRTRTHTYTSTHIRPVGLPAPDFKVICLYVSCALCPLRSRSPFLLPPCPASALLPLLLRVALFVFVIYLIIVVVAVLFGRQHSNI